jgi:indole-3-glycerol phosphate synthase
LSLPVDLLEQTEDFSRPVLSLREYLLNEDLTGIIAEFKRKSPSKGWIHEGADVKQITAAYENHGAAALSILTDYEFFGGSNADLEEARFNPIPILRKEFIVDEYQVLEAKSIGADAILLIAACLTRQEIRSLARLARSLGLEVLLELHEEDEIGHICEETGIVGINNRNLKTFTVNMDRSLKMAELIPTELVKVTESGISSLEQITLFKKNGFRGFLIGEHFMKEKEPGIAFASFVNKLKNFVHED